MAAQAKLPPLIVSTPGPAFRTSFQIEFGVTGKVYQCPSFRVQAGMTVTLSPVTRGMVNAAPCSVAERASLVGTSTASTLPAAADVAIEWLTDNTGKIFVAGLSGDGLLVTVNEPGFG
jgi:hypothetical protein